MSGMASIPGNKPTPQDLRDLQVLSQLAWFDEYFLEGDGEVAYLVPQGPGLHTGRSTLDGAQAAGISGGSDPYL